MFTCTAVLCTCTCANTCTGYVEYVRTVLVLCTGTLWIYVASTISPGTVHALFLRSIDNPMLTKHQNDGTCVLCFLSHTGRNVIHCCILQCFSLILFAHDKTRYTSFGRRLVETCYSSWRVNNQFNSFLSLIVFCG